MEIIRQELADEYNRTKWDEDFTKEIILVSKELGIGIDEILEWTIMRYRVVTHMLKEIYEEANMEANIHSNVRTLR